MNSFLNDHSDKLHFHVRTIDDQLTTIKDFFIKHPFKSSTCLIAHLMFEEHGSVEKNLHYHYHLIVSSMSKPNSIAKYLRIWLNKKYNHSNYYVSPCKDIEKSMVYISKEGHLHSHSALFTPELLEELRKKNEHIETDKKLPMFKKLFLRYDSTHGDKQLHDDRQITRFIIQQYKEWNILFPNRSQMLQYSAYIKAQYVSVDQIADEFYSL